MFVLIADSHIIEGTPGEQDFWRMLDRIARSDYDVCFLGDILELWLGLDRYESSLHYRFLQWCKEQKQQRRVFLVEGNHEFFVWRRYRDCFTEVAPNTLVWENTLFAHGDLIRRKNFSHTLFRLSSKSRLTMFLLSVVPGAPWLVAKIKKMMEKRALHRKLFFPYASVDAWARNIAIKQQVSQVILGHYHQFTQGGGTDYRWVTLPDWKKTLQVGILDGEKLQLKHWRKI